jgi:hypothetical protein
VSISAIYRLKVSEKFETSFEKLIKSHYKKDAKSRARFEGIIGSFFDEVCHDHKSGDLEPFPDGLITEGYELRKKRWNLPGLRGAAKKGRLIYLVKKHKDSELSEESQEGYIYILWIYTHEEYGKPPNTRPPASDLAKAIKGAQSS